MKTITLLQFFVSMAAAALGAFSYCQADTLDELMRSPTKEEFDQQSGRLRSKTRGKEYWVDPDSNYGSIFQSYKSSERMIRWLSDSAISYVRFELKTKKFPEFVMASAQFTMRGSNLPLYLEVLLPHPRYLASARFALIDQFADREPPRLKVESSKAIKVRGKEATYYQVDQKKCSVLIKGPRQVLIVAQNPACDKPNDLIYFVNSLDLSRLFKNLGS